MAQVLELPNRELKIVVINMLMSVKEKEDNLQKGTATERDGNPKEGRKFWKSKTSK